MTVVPIAELMQTYTHAFLTAVVSRHRCHFCCVSISFLRQKCAPHTQQRLVQLCLHSDCHKPCLTSSLELHPGGLNYSLALQRHKLCYCRPLHYRSNDYLTIFFFDNYLLLMLLIRSTNRFSPTHSFIKLQLNH